MPAMKGFAQSVASGACATEAYRQRGSVRQSNARFVTTSHTLAKPGYHTLKICIDNLSVVVQKLVMNTSESRNAST
jgi:hypothetical protein